ncbi:hypothetical protein NCAS_0A04220 [Naumovozyma castellii]|uniref:Protein kinase domain-containing protein n=1 Tax=Naumovozyma castellii TaxID=27288 RepID=G0V688_NAUCA|nr:hypothetical protein NCAS_0A04220 [Naumovozyma castellii CBS 4309]CCC66980.1 hypothetical protein NCAS_0A04220 [Naumovozyma castellii CBS 4309]
MGYDNFHNARNRPHKNNSKNFRRRDIPAGPMNNVNNKNNTSSRGTKRLRPNNNNNTNNNNNNKKKLDTRHKDNDHNQRRFKDGSRYQAPVTAPVSRYNNSNGHNSNNKNNNRLLHALPKGPKHHDGSPQPSSPSSSSRYDSKTQASPIHNLPTKPALSTTVKRAKPNPLPVPVSFLNEVRTSSIYERIVQVGEGTYGKVYKARNEVTSHLVALKKLRLNNEKDGFPITSIREIKLLQTFHHPNIATLVEIMVESSKMVYMIFEYADNDLTGLLGDKNVVMSLGQRKHLFQQLLRGVKYLHDSLILHRDIKGSNILIDNKGNLKITDFGLARKMHVKSDSDGSNDYTNRVITLWYRPPELLMGTTNYSTEVDMWGCGCILMELFNNVSIFQGQNEIEQLLSIFKIMGSPNLDNWPNFFEMPWFFMIIPMLTEKYPDLFEEKYKNLLPSSECFNLAKGLLLYDQKKRLSAEEALKSPYFTEDPQPEPLILEGYVGCHEYEIKMARKQQKREEEPERERQKEV